MSTTLEVTASVKPCARCGILREIHAGRSVSSLCRSCDVVERRPPRRFLPDIDCEDTCEAGHWLVDGNVRMSDTGEKICAACENQEQQVA